MTTVAVVGPGAIGGALAAWLVVRGAHDVTLCARRAFPRLQLHDGDRKIDATPRVVTAPHEVGPAPFVLVATKVYDVPLVGPWLARLCDPGTRVAIVQNGVEHVERFAGLVPLAQLVPVVVDLPAVRTAPGEVRVLGQALLTVPDTGPGRDVAALFDGTPVCVTRTDDFTTAAWRKLCLNAAGIVPAIHRTGDGIARDPAVAAAMHAIVRETIAVGRAAGAMLADALADEVVDRCRAAPPDRFNSLTADHVAGRPTEVDARNGAVVRFGARFGIPTPHNEAAIAALG